MRQALRAVLFSGKRISYNPDTIWNITIKIRGI